MTFYKNSHRGQKIFVAVKLVIVNDFSARQHMLSALLLSPVRLSVHPSVTRVDQSKTVEVRIMKLLLYGSHIPLVFAG